ncbi:hypothetical protein GCM10010910_01010 [Microbacterium nanhaiense]|uniref:Uncharacterized protein n=1 Tax=Microbacterium nanhaiense TaxID=1301026 RepID=A0ABQ2MUS5_9MICO|nr:hypothetical protein [Microbacterium nanhaiense]GGO59033.1 hypothetical protein GCM10010910_01010 [Microbacterium nanhaiense]
MTVQEKPMFVLTAQKRAVRRPEGVRGTSMLGWVSDEEGFARRWGNRRPDIGVQRSQIAQPLIERATAMNEAQLQSGFLDFLYVVDVETPVHVCTPECPTEGGES